MGLGAPALLVVIVLAACQPAPTAVKPVTASAGVVIVTASNHLLSLSLTKRKVEWDIGLGGSPQSDFTAHLMAFTSDKARVAVLVRGSTSQVVIVDATTGRELARHSLATGLIYRGLDVGPISGRVYVFANR
jgi:outer membrane protein assembly factor BamB